MAQEKKTYSQLFEPPQGYFGQICIASALSADVIFVEKMLKTFTGKCPEQRRLDDSVYLYLMLNQGQPDLIQTTQIPGFLQLQPNCAELWEKVYCQHAKVSIMRFGKFPMSKEFIVDDDIIWRLVVCTGNWTETSARNQIEMVWSIEISKKKLDPQNAYDLLEATKFLKSLRLLYTCVDSQWDKASKMISEIIQTCSSVSCPQTRFVATLPIVESIDEMKKSNGKNLLIQIKERFKSFSGSDKKNFILIGSGFFENANKTKEKPVVLKQIEREILNDLPFTKNPDKEIVANDNIESAGQLIYWDDRDWTIWGVEDPEEESKRFLHAKYIFLGKYLQGTNRVRNGILYVGSGNLSHKGMLSAFGVESSISQKKGRGNIEAGIVFLSDEELPEKLEDFYSSLACKPEELDLPEKGDSVEKNEDEPAPFFQEPSIIQAIQAVDAHSFVFKWRPDVLLKNGFCSVRMNDNDQQVNLGSNNIFCWSDWHFEETPNEQWMTVFINGQKRVIPCITSDGNFVEYKRPIKDFDELLDFLDNFPRNVDSLEDDEDKKTEAEIKSDNRQKGDGVNRRNQISTYLYGDAAKLVERIADLNDKLFSSRKDLNENQIHAWIETIKKCLKCLPSSLIDEYKKLNVDFVSVLKNPNGFAPVLENEDLQKKWKDFIDKWSADWFTRSAEKIWEDEDVELE